MKSSVRIVYSLIVFVLGIVLLSVLTVFLIYENRQTTLSFDQVNRTHILRASMARVDNSITAAEADLRTYLLSDDPSFLESYRLRNKEVSLLLNDSISNADDDHQKLVASLLSVNRLREDAGNQVLASHSAASDTKEGVLTTHRLTLEAHSFIAQMIDLEDKQLEDVERGFQRHRHLPAIIGIAVSIFSIIVFILAFYFTNSELRKSHYLNMELEKKNVQLENYMRELGTFTHITTHDMQEPLRKVELFISMIEDREKASLSPKALEYFEKIRESVSRMRHLYFSVLTLSLADEVRNQKERVDLNEVLNETMESLRVYIKDTNAMISSDRLPQVDGVKNQLVQLFQNLISNALKYKRPNVIPEIVISCETVSGESSSVRDLERERMYYRIGFRDNGVGFDDRYTDRIFEIFQRQVRDESHGVGIGLSICRKIAQNHAGAITASSQIDKGSVFSVFLPV